MVPTPRVSQGEFTSAAAVSSTDVWAVGFHSGLENLTEHWDGMAWEKVGVPAPSNGQLLAVSATSSTDVWAVGFYDKGVNRSLTEHWDGAGWTWVPSPNPGQARKGDTFLAGISAIGPDDAWAVGFSTGGVAGTP